MTNSHLVLPSPSWLTWVSIASLFQASACALFILGDILAGRRQKMGVMNLVWPITALYFGFVGLWAYLLMGRAEKNSRERVHSHGHDHESKPFWMTTFIATCHCGAGCVVGDLIGEWLLFLTGFRLFGSMLLTAFAVDFVLAYLFGIIFQYFSIAPMRNLGFKDGLIAAIKADTVSLTAFEIGMFACMALNHYVVFPFSLAPTSPIYWFAMQIAMIAGFATSYPANWWLVRSGLKEAM